MTHYMISLRDPEDQGQIAANPRFLAVDDHQTVTDLGDATAWRQAILNAFPERNETGLPKGALLFFVHGFNVNFDHALTGDLSHIQNLKANGWDGIYASFDWPSAGSVFDYYKDRSTARASANALIDTALAQFVDALQPACDVTLSVMAHSMGALVVRLAFSWAYQDTKINKKTWQVSQLLLVAGDVAQGSLSETQDGGRWIDKYVGRTTDYSNSYDSVLKVSDIKNGEPTPRAGRVGLPADAPASFCNVDCSALYSSIPMGPADQLNPATPHGFYFDRTEFWQDVVLTLAGGTDRAAIPTRAPTGVANRFTLELQPMAAADYETALRLASLGR